VNPQDLHGSPAPLVTPAVFFVLAESGGFERHRRRGRARPGTRARSRPIPLSGRPAGSQCRGTKRAARSESPRPAWVAGSIVTAGAFFVLVERRGFE